MGMRAVELSIWGKVNKDGVSSGAGVPDDNSVGSAVGMSVVGGGGVDSPFTGGKRLNRSHPDIIIRTIIIAIMVQSILDKPFM